jgi:hypothetical protein
MLEDMLRQEQDVSYQGLLKRIIERDDEIAKLHEEVDKLQRVLPKPYDVKRGDNHYKICFKYLTDVEKVPKDSTDKLIDRVALIDELVPGFQIWLYFKDGVFGTFVTQGKARISPNTFRYVTRKQAVEKAKEQARQEVRDSLMRMQDTVALKKMDMQMLQDTTRK